MSSPHCPICHSPRRQSPPPHNGGYTCGTIGNQASQACHTIAQLLESLEQMADQYLSERTGGHQFMSAGECTTTTLTELYPHRWQDTGRGPIRITPTNPQETP